MRLRSWLKYNKTLAGEIDGRLANPEIQGDERLDLYLLRDQVRLEIVNYEILRRPQNDPLYWSDIFPRPPSSSWCATIGRPPSASKRPAGARRRWASWPAR